jgi:hypothetical protein
VVDKDIEYREMVPTAYLAGLFDGEGCIRISKDKMGRSNPRYALIITVNNTNPIPLHFFKNRYGGSINTRYFKSFKPIHSWTITSKNGQRFLEDVLDNLWIKRDEALLGIEFQKRIGLPLSAQEYEAREELYLRCRDIKGRKWTTHS